MNHILNAFVVTLLTFFSGATLAQDCKIEAGEKIFALPEVIEFGQLRVKFATDQYEYDKPRVYVLDIRAPNFERRGVQLRPNIPITMQVCGQEVTLNAGGGSAHGYMRLRISVF